jgi:hypothetical protein
MILRSKLVEGQASYSNERYLYTIVDLSELNRGTCDANTWRYWRKSTYLSSIIIDGKSCHPLLGETTRFLIMQKWQVVVSRISSLLFTLLEQRKRKKYWRIFLFVLFLLCFHIFGCVCDWLPKEKKNRNR